MERYKRGEAIQDHTLKEVYERYGASQETEFVQKFFKDSEIQAILENCGVDVHDVITSELEHPVQIGYSNKRADLVCQGEDGAVYYFEVMSQSYAGKWDDDHHQQFYLKSTRLGQLHETVYSFAIGFKEFDPRYLEEFQKMDNWYAIHLRFNDHGYFPDVYGVEEKKQKNAVRNIEKEALGLKYLEVAKEFGYSLRKDVPVYANYLLIGKGYEGNKKVGIEWVLSSRAGRIGIKLTGRLYKLPQFKSLNENAEENAREMERAIEGLKFLNTGIGGNDSAYYFQYDKEDFSEENKQLLRKVTEEFARIFGVTDLLK